MKKLLLALILLSSCQQQMPYLVTPYGCDCHSDTITSFLSLQDMARSVFVYDSTIITNLNTGETITAYK